MGKSGYDEKYFDQARFDYPEANSEGHNTILVNGESQISGKYYKKPYDYNVGGEVLDFRTTAQRDYVLMDATNAYPKKELKKWRRNVVLEKPQITLVLDEIHSNKNAAIQVRFHPGVNLKILQDYVLLKGKEGTMALIPFTEKDFTINQGRHPSQMVNATQSFSWIPYFDLTLKATGYKTIIGNLILPVDNENQVEDIMASKKIELNKEGNLNIIFSYKNKIFKYYFKNNKSGLELD